MHQKRFVLCSATALLALAIACSKSQQTPISPTPSPEATSDAAPDGSTLKVTKPVPQSPVNGAQPNSLTLVAGVSTPLYPVAPVPALSYDFEIRTTAGATVCTATGTPSGSTVSVSPTCTLALDTPYTWRVRAGLAANKGPWADNASFRSPLGGYIDRNEVYDPLYSGTSVGQVFGSTTFVPNQGLRLNTHESRVSYQLTPALEQGEISVMVIGIAEDNPGDKTKIFTMQEGSGGDITDNDYRMTVEKRGRSYPQPGATTWRIIMGDADEHAGRIIDAPERLAVDYSDERWYFWKFTWGTGRAALEVRADGPRGPVIYANSRGTGGFAYRPNPHFAHLGSTVGRGGPIDASIPGATYKNLWISSRPRPAFPGE